MAKYGSMVSIVAALFFVCFLFAGVARADDPPPQWLQEAARLSVPKYEVRDVPAVVLRNEESVSVSTDGTVTRTLRFAVRILIREGRDEAIARLSYQTDGEKVRDMNAWLIRSSGPSKSYGKKEIADVALAENDVYNEARIKVIRADNDADTGDVFGYEATMQERTVFSQFQFRFQVDIPILYSKFSLDLPAGWKAESVTFNRNKVEPVVNGSSYSWELRDLPPIPPEARSPRRSSLSPRLAVSFFPAQPTVTQIKTFANWGDVARWMSEIEDPQMSVDDALAGKAKELTANARTEFERIKAISRYVQQIQYISIQIGTGRGGGYRPHLATDVFAKSYGDCKDKANVMRAMLSVLRIPSYMVSITADDPTYVRAEWASPHQFNHCIIAIKISDETKAPSIVMHPTLGRLLIFDPTDPYTQLGDIPEDEQGSLALIDHKDSDSLVTIPTMPAELNRLDRVVDISLGADGAIAGKLIEKTSGQNARTERARARRLSVPDYNLVIERWLSAGATGAKTTRIEAKEGESEGNFDLSVDFSAAAYAQIMQGKLMVFKPAIVSRLDRLAFTEGKRFHPYMVEASAYTENVKVKLPPGFSVDELPDAINLETPFGNYSTSYVVNGEYLTFARSLRLNRSTIPADKYETIRDFFSRIRTAEQSPVVLVRK